MDPTDTCAALAREVDEPLAGTAPVALGWMAVEVPGAWGRETIRQSSLDDALAARLVGAAAEVPVRLQSIRRSAVRPSGAAEGRTVVLAHSGPTPWCEVLTEVSDDDLGEIDPAVCAGATPPGLGRRHLDPLLLVCTHASRDRCCASLGRPVADTLTALHPTAVWETSHVGGHRFAANLVVLPQGLVYGGLDVASAVEAVALHLAGRLDVGHLRGRSGRERPAQAVEVLARHELGLDRPDDLQVVEVEADDHEVVGVVDTPSGRAEIRLHREASGRWRRLSCDSDEPEDPAAFRLRSVTTPVG